MCPVPVTSFLPWVWLSCSLILFTCSMEHTAPATWGQRRIFPTPPPNRKASEFRSETLDLNPKGPPQTPDPCHMRSPVTICRTNEWPVIGFHYSITPWPRCGPAVGPLWPRWDRHWLSCADSSLLSFLDIRARCINPSAPWARQAPAGVWHLNSRIDFPSAWSPCAHQMRQKPC